MTCAVPNCDNPVAQKNFRDTGVLVRTTVYDGDEYEVRLKACKVDGQKCELCCDAHNLMFAHLIREEMFREAENE